jgi:CheY-like chemotaxis protein
MFERFRQADSSFARQQGGLGLGLAIVRELVELHGGTVCAESPGLGQGTTIRVRLPVVRPATAGADVADRAASAALPAMGNLAAAEDWSKRQEGVRVVVVDDEEDTIGLLEQMLKAAGADVRTARSAAGALAELERDVPDVLVSDIGMPGMDGLELIRRLRQSPNDTLQAVPALALTAYARLEDRVAALASGYHMHMVKPADPAELVLGVAALARRRDRTSAIS